MKVIMLNYVTQYSALNVVILYDSWNKLDFLKEIGKGVI